MCWEYLERNISDHEYYLTASYTWSNHCFAMGRASSLQCPRYSLSTLLLFSHPLYTEVHAFLYYLSLDLPRKLGPLANNCHCYHKFSLWIDAFPIQSVFQKPCQGSLAAWPPHPVSSLLACEQTNNCNLMEECSISVLRSYESDQG